MGILIGGHVIDMANRSPYSGKLLVADVNKSILAGGEDLVLGEINPELKTYQERQVASKKRRKERLAQMRTYRPPEDDIVQIGTAQPSRKRI